MTLPMKKVFYQMGWQFSVFSVEMKHNEAIAKLIRRWKYENSRNIYVMNHDILIPFYKWNDETTDLILFLFILGVKTYFISGRVQPLNEVTIPQIRRIDPKEIRASTFDDSNGQAKTNRTGSSASNILKHSSFQKHIHVSTENKNTNHFHAELKFLLKNKVYS